MIVENIWQKRNFKIKIKTLNTLPRKWYETIDRMEEREKILEFKFGTIGFNFFSFDYKTVAPYRNTYLVLKENKLHDFYYFLLSYVFNSGYGLVIEIDLLYSEQPIFNEDLTKLFGDYGSFYNRNLNKDFNKSNFVNNLFKEPIFRSCLKPWTQFYVGYTNQKSEDLKNGLEVICRIKTVKTSLLKIDKDDLRKYEKEIRKKKFVNEYLEIVRYRKVDKEEMFYEYIFVPNLEKIVFFDDGITYYYYITNDSVSNSIKLELERLYKKYPNTFLIDLGVNFFPVEVLSYNQSNLHLFTNDLKNKLKYTCQFYISKSGFSLDKIKFGFYYAPSKIEGESWSNKYQNCNYNDFFTP